MYRNAELEFWAKVDPETGKWHSLVSHLLDSAAVAEIIWDEILASNTRKLMAESLGLSERDARGWVVFLVALHDVGKASPVFQMKWPERARVLEQTGFPFPKYVLPIPHGRVTTLTLMAELKRRGVPARVANELARASGGHHGVFDTATALQACAPQATGTGRWVEARESLTAFLAEQCCLRGFPARKDLAGLTLIAGLTTVCDWIASSEAHFPYSGRQADVGAVGEMARERAGAALAVLGWRARMQFPEPLFFQEFFRVGEPRPLQRECIEVAERLQGPSLVLVEAPMGEGKTEAALFLATRQAQRFGLRGNYFALPTQATSNQMFGRIVAILGGGGAGGTANLMLLHGHASLSTVFEELQRLGQSDFGVRGIDPEGGEGGTVAAGEWFTYRKRGLLAPYGVGTIDQVLLAALQSKHVFVRLFGLAGKIVVIDEVHAYDTYMSALLERLLAWLRSIGASTVLLSATLPRQRREGLLRAYDPNAKISVESPSYPRVTVADGSGVQVRSFASANPNRSMRLAEAPEDAGMLAEWIRERIAGGGCAAVVCNTVGRSQEVFVRCRDAMPGHAEDGSPVVDLLHSRFPFGQREEREQRTLRRFGKGGECVRPRRAVLVATQIIEQSLDIDFDVMVTDLAPIDLLLQRAGRLHRHERGPRVTGDAAVLGLVRTEADAEGVPEFGRAQTAVYEEHVLLQTWMALRGRTELSLPDEIAPLIEEVYAEPGNPPAEDGLLAAWERSWESLRVQRDKDLREASARFLPHPDSGARLESLTDMGRDEDEQAHPFFRALTRLAERSVTTVCLYGDMERAYLDERRQSPLAIDVTPDEVTVAKLLRNSLSVSDRRIVQHLEEIPTPSAWRRSALLRKCRPLWLDESGGCDVGRYRVLVSRETGLRIEERVSANI